MDQWGELKNDANGLCGVFRSTFDGEILCAIAI